MPMEVVEPQNVIAWIVSQMEEGQTFTDFAKQIGVDRQSLYDVLQGKKLPSKAMLSKLGLRVVYEIIKPEQKPAGRKK
jgi:predicted transcriptional regulator